VSGDDPIRLAAPGDSVLARAVEVLGRFPSDQRWVLIGGIAVFIRLGAITRPTADADAVARSQRNLLARLVEAEPAAVITGGDVTIPAAGGLVEVDVMDLADTPLPAEPERRAFALARRLALDTAGGEHIVVTDADARTVADAILPVATIPALTALKTVSMVRRPHSNSPQKVGSDIHDLVRLITTGGARAIAADLANADPELARWVADHIDRGFGQDLRYTILRLRRNDRSASAQALTDDDIAGVGILADAIRDQAEN
jgi:hypothetical protein